MLIVCLLLNVPARYYSVSQGRACSDDCSCCHTDAETAGQPLHITQSRYTDTGRTSPRANPISPDPWQDSHWSTKFEVTGRTQNVKIPAEKAGTEPRVCRSPGLMTSYHRPCSYTLAHQSLVKRLRPQRGLRDVGRTTIKVQMHGLFVCWLLNVPATCECFSGTDLLRQFYVLSH